MFKKLLVNKYFLPILYLIAVSLFKWQFQPFFLVGGVLGIFALEFFDKIGWAYVTHPENPSSASFRHNLETLKLKNIFSSWPEYNESRNHTIKSFLFQVILLIFTFYVLSLGDSSLASGLLLIFNLEILISQYQEQQAYGQLVNWSFLTNIYLNRQKSFLYFLAASGFFLLLTLQYIR